MEPDKVYIVGVQGYDGINIFGVCYGKDFAEEFAEYKQKEIRCQVNVWPYEIMDEY